MNLPQVVGPFVALTIFLIHHRGHVLGVAITPPGVVTACSGGLLELTCTTPGSFLEWSFFLFPEGETTARRYSRNLHPETPATASKLMINSTIFTFSTEGSEPLISMLLIDPVSEDLNGTEVNCTDVERSNSTSTRIQVINESIMIGTVGHQNMKITVTTLSKLFERECVTVTLELIELNTLLNYSYHINATPQLISHMFFGRKMVQLNVSYNVHYNVSVLAASPCGKNNVTTLSELYYANCGTPADQIDSSIVNIMGYRDPAIAGSNIIISCTSGHVQNGTIIAMCRENGKWEPDIKEIASNCSDMMTESVVTNIMDSSNVVLGATLGIVISAVVLVTLSLIVVIIVFYLRARDKNDNHNNIVLSQDYEYERYTLNTESSFNIDHQKSASGLVYADIAQSSYNRQPSHLTSTHLLDDDAIEYARLNHNLSVTSTALKTHLEPTEDNTCVNLDNVLIQLRPQVTSKWHQFGEAVGIENEVLDSCAKTCSPEDCIVEMLDYWLRNSSKKPTWRDIAEALKAINLPQLALNIEMVYSTGKLPVDVDMNQVSELQKGSFNHETTTELPPPLPPKMTEDEDVPQSKVVAENQASVPALPPKPVNKFVFH